MGYWGLIVLFGLTGYYIGDIENKIISKITIAKIIILGAELIPIYIHRILKYEIPYDELTKIREDIAGWLPAVLSIYGLAIFILFGLNLNWSMVDFKVEGIRYALCIIPYAAFSIYRQKKLSPSGETLKDIDKSKLFRYRTLIPGMFTGIMPVLFGWSLTYDMTYGVFFCLLIPIALLGLIIAISSKIKHVFYVSSIVVIILFLTILIVPLWGVEHILLSFIRIFLFGVMLTLSVGISETWYTTKRIQIAKKRHNQNDDFYKENLCFYSSGVNYSMGVVYPLFMFSVFLSGVETFSASWLAIPFFTLASFTFWVFLGDKWSDDTWRIIRLFNGYLLPAFLLYLLYQSKHNVYPANSFNVNISWITGLGLTLIISTLGLLYKQRFNIVRNTLRESMDRCGDASEAASFFAFCCCLLWIASVIGLKISEVYIMREQYTLWGNIEKLSYYFMGLFVLTLILSGISIASMRKKDGTNIEELSA